MTAAAMPTYPELRRRIAELMLERHEWAGAPVPIEGLRLRLEPSYPYQGLATLLAEPAGTGLEPGETLVNAWYSRRRSAHVFLVRSAEGRTVAYALPERGYLRRFEIGIRGAEASFAHDLEAEMTAMLTLHEHVTDAQMRQYTLLGQFIERSKRSGVFYLFRRCRPTVAFRADDSGSRPLAVLCMHPIGYYEDTTVGAMTPTDDVLAHLLLMRGDEVMLWRRCYQHHPSEPEAML